MKKQVRFISTILSKLFLPLLLFFITLVLIDGAEHKYISPFIIISDLVLIIAPCAVIFFIKEKLHTDDQKVTTHSTYGMYINYFITILVTSIVALQSLYLPLIQNIVVMIITILCTIIIVHIMQHPLTRYHKLTLAAVCILMAGVLLSSINLNNGFMIYDFWNHYNNSKFFAINGILDFHLFSYASFYVLLGSILNLAGTNIIVAQWLYGIGVSLIFIFGSYSFYYIGKKLDHPKFGILSAILFILLPATSSGGLSFFIPNTISLMFWPLLFFFGIQKKSWQNIILFILTCLVILLYHPWDLVLLLPIFIIWKMSIRNKVHWYPLWIFGFGILILAVEIILYVFLPEQFFALNSLLPGFIGIYNDTISSISSISNYNPQILFVLKNIPLVPFALLGTITIVIDYIKQHRNKKFLKLTEFLISQSFLFIALLILAVLFPYNFRIVIFILFVSVPLAGYFIYLLLKKHWLLGGVISSVLIGVLVMQNTLIYSQLGKSEYSSKLESIGITEGVNKINYSSNVLTDPYSLTYILAFSNHFNTHSNPNHENEYLDIFASSNWSNEQIAYLKNWDIEYIAVTNRTIEWGRTGVPVTATNDYIESLDTFIATKEQIHKKLRDVFEVVYSNDDFALYRVDLSKIDP